MFFGIIIGMVFAKDVLRLSRASANTLSSVQCNAKDILHSEENVAVFDFTCQNTQTVLSYYGLD